MIERKDWFEEWFDSEYYHILYQNRDDKEAEHFIDNLVEYLGCKSADKILDIPCGKGRHSIYLNCKGFDVTGADLSANSIKQAKNCSGNNLRFLQHDMRHAFPDASFNYIFNLFTSFGYFDSEKENLDVLLSFRDALNEDGKIIIDFLNTNCVVKELVADQVKEIDGIVFQIKKKLESGVIVKDIAFEDRGKKYHFQERVRALLFQDFMNYFEKAGLKVTDVLGDYNLNPYLPEKSERMIFVLQKPAIGYGI